MRCSRCSAEAPGGASFCTRCGYPLGGREGPQAVTLKRPPLITVLSLLHYFGSVLTLLAAASLSFAAHQSSPALIFTIGFAGLGLLQLVGAHGLWTLKGYGRTIEISLACIGLLAFPIGTIVSVLILIH